MNVSDVLNVLDNWLIPQVKWDSDSIGLQIGDKTQQVKKILLALNPTPEVIKEAAHKKCDMVITHHPLLYRPLKKIIKGDFYADTAIACIKNNISYAACHTNFDLVKDGVSFALARELGLQQIKPLVPLSELPEVTLQENYKLAVYTPAGHEELLKKAIAAAGGATIGDYDCCFFETEGRGSFRPGNGSDPFVGEQGKITQTNETKIETIVPAWTLNNVISAIKKTHPYEEVAYDVLKLDTNSNNFGLGSIGSLAKKISLKDCMKLIGNTLGTKNLRLAVHNPDAMIQRIAVCGGSGAAYWQQAHTQKADLYLTSEFDHHSYLEAKRYLNIVDASHHATEQFAVKRLQEYLSLSLTSMEIAISETDRDPLSELAETE